MRKIKKAGTLGSGGLVLHELMGSMPNELIKKYSIIYMVLRGKWDSRKLLYKEIKSAEI